LFGLELHEVPNAGPSARPDGILSVHAQAIFLRAGLRRQRREQIISDLIGHWLARRLRTTLRLLVGDLDEKNLHLAAARFGWRLRRELRRGRRELQRRSSSAAAAESAA
jgi:hypothetical protein